MIQCPFTKITENGKYRPYLFITLLNPQNGKSMSLYALIDTGADECCFPVSYAKILGHDLKKGKTKNINSANGLAVVYSHTARIFTESYMTEEITVDFSESLNTPLLGVNNFLSNFVLTLNYPENYIILK